MSIEYVLVHGVAIDWEQRVTCQDCKTAFTYQFTSTGNIQLNVGGRRPTTSEMTEKFRGMSEEARREAMNYQGQWVSLHPCPGCGKYQAWMEETLEGRHLNRSQNWTFFLGIIAFLILYSETNWSGLQIMLTTIGIALTGGVLSFFGSRLLLPGRLTGGKAKNPIPPTFLQLRITE